VRVVPESWGAGPVLSPDIVRGGAEGGLERNAGGRRGTRADPDRSPPGRGRGARRLARFHRRRRRGFWIETLYTHKTRLIQIRPTPTIPLVFNSEDTTGSSADQGINVLEERRE